MEFAPGLLDPNTLAQIAVAAAGAAAAAIAYARIRSQRRLIPVRVPKEPKAQEES